MLWGKIYQVREWGCYFRQVVREALSWEQRPEGHEGASQVNKLGANRVSERDRAQSCVQTGASVFEGRRRKQSVKGERGDRGWGQRGEQGELCRPLMKSVLSLPAQWFSLQSQGSRWPPSPPLLWDVHKKLHHPCTITSLICEVRVKKNPSCKSAVRIRLVNRREAGYESCYYNWNYYFIVGGYEQGLMKSVYDLEKLVQLLHGK